MNSTEKEIKKSTKTRNKPKTEKSRFTPHGRIYITSTFNNTLITVTNDKGDTLGWSSSGHRGFKGTRKSTPYAASLSVEDVTKRLIEKGLKTVDVFVKGPGSGRDSSLRAIKTSGLSIISIADITPIPHNGPRAKKKSRV